MLIQSSTEPTALAITEKPTLDQRLEAIRNKTREAVLHTLTHNPTPEIAQQKTGNLKQVILQNIGLIVNECIQNDFETPPNLTVGNKINERVFNDCCRAMKHVNQHEISPERQIGKQKLILTVFKTVTCLSTLFDGSFKS